MSSINNSYEYYQCNQSLLSMLNKSKSGNPLINQLISNNEIKYQQKMESLGIGTTKNNTKYKNVDNATNNLLDALEKLDDKDLYTAESGKEYDKSKLIKGVTNFVAAYNSTISNLDSCGGALNKNFKTEFTDTFKENAASFEKIGITINTDKKLSVDQEKLNAANQEDIKALLGNGSSYRRELISSANSMDSIINKALSMRSGTYNANGFMMY